MLRWPAVLIAIIVLALLAAGGYWLYDSSGASALPAVTPAGLNGQPSLAQGQVMAEGTIMPRSSAKLAFKLGGRVTDLRVKEGDKVMQGEVLVELDNVVLRQQLNQAEAAVEVAQKQLSQLMAGGSDADRKAAEDAVAAAQAKYDDAKEVGNSTATKAAAAALSEAKSAVARLDPSPTAVAIAEAQVREAQAALDVARSALDEASLKAPFPGTIAQVSLNVGDFVSPGLPVVVIGDLSGLRVESDDLSDLDIARVRVGQPVLVTLDALPGRLLHGIVASVSPMATESRGYRVFHIWIDLKEGIETGARWGMAAKVEVPME